MRRWEHYLSRWGEAGQETSSRQHSKFVIPQAALQRGYAGPRNTGLFELWMCATGVADIATTATPETACCAQTPPFTARVPGSRVPPLTWRPRDDKFCAH